MSPPPAPPSRSTRSRRLLRALLRERRGAIAVIFALLAPLLALCVIGAIDIATLESTKTHLQDATDAAALAVSAAAAANPNTTETSLLATATTLLQTDFQNGSQAVGALTPTISSFKVCTPVAVVDCLVVNGQAVITDTVSMVTTVRAQCYSPIVLPGLCNSSSQSAPMTVVNTTNIGFASNVEINMMLDVSGSMIVGATPGDVQKVVTWNSTAANWNSVRDTGDSSQSTPCAFACHDHHSSNSTTYGSANSDMQAGETNAKAAGATTRLDEMLSSVGKVISTEQTNVSQSTQLSKDNYYFNLYSVADNLSTVYKAATPNDWTDPVNALNNVYVGLDTHLNENLPGFANAVAANGVNVAGIPTFKLAIIITDGLESDFYQDFCTNGFTPDSAWDVSGYYGSNSASPQWYGYYTGACFAAPMSIAQCQAMQNQGVIVAVIETPYVPLTGQDPGEQYLYETWVRHTLYPGGPSQTTSTVSAQLQACATQGYYRQADPTNISSIASNLTSLVNKFIASTAYIKQ